MTQLLSSSLAWTLQVADQPEFCFFNYNIFASQIAWQDLFKIKQTKTRVTFSLTNSVHATKSIHLTVVAVCIFV